MVHIGTTDSSTPVLPTNGAISSLRPLGANGVVITGGFWGERLAVNRARTLRHGFEQLQQAGNLQNFRIAAGVPGHYRALGEPRGLIFPFLDSDVYKWLEAVGWELGRAPEPDLASAADEAISAVAGAQRPDGYLNTYVQVVAGGRQYADLAWGHELYCIGHLIQAGIAWHRTLGDDRLLDIAVRAVDSVERELGPEGRPGIDGHPEIEMALVELFRTTGDRRHLGLASRFVGARGHGLLGEGRFGAEYWQDHATVRDATSVAGHAVRQLYLDSGAVDVATELGDAALLDAVMRRWRDMVATRTYLTGGVGSRHRDEAFGDPYELPPDRAYAETCGAIASVMLAWRLLLATGDPACADLIERTMFNGVLPGVALDGTSFFYVNPLQRRTTGVGSTHGDGRRKPWYDCACCPPNLMRTLSSWPQHVATSDGAGIQIHQFAAGDVTANPRAGVVRLSVETAYPWAGDVLITVRETPEEPWALSLRVPGWCQSATIEVASDGRRDVRAGERIVEATRAWRAGDQVVLRLDMPARLTDPDPRIDAVRGSVALERGPIVYCVETRDLPPDTDLEDVELDRSVAPRPDPRDDIASGVIGIAFGGIMRAVARTGWPYGEAAAVPGAMTEKTPFVGRAVPYFAWANRSVEAMRVWIPAAEDRDETGS
jgi:DUF1680 family protein